MLRNRSEAFDLLKSLDAPYRLILHGQLVSEAADRLLLEFQALGVTCDARVVEIGAAIHDAGKISHPEELSVSGSLHEEAGEALLLAHGVQPELARCCVSHGSWDLPGVSFEERIVALADMLWKGKREPSLELSVIDEIAARLKVSRWDVFQRVDTVFEEIAAAGSERLDRS